MNEKQVIDYAKRGRKYSDVVLLNEANNVTYLLGIIQCLGLQLNKEEEFDEELSNVWEKESCKIAKEMEYINMDDFNSDMNRILTIKRNLGMQIRMLRLIGKHNTTLRHIARDYTQSIRAKNYPEEIIECDDDLF